MKAAGPVMSDAEWRQRFRYATRAEMDALVSSPEANRLSLRDRRSALNRRIIKPLREGWLPGSAHPGNSVEGFGSDRLPKVVNLCRRYWDAWDAAYAAKEAEYAQRPVDDAAWEVELRRRASVTAWLNGDRFGRAK